MFSWKEKKSDGAIVDVLLEYMARNLNITEMAIEKAIDMTAKMIAKCKFRQYKQDPNDGKIKKANEHILYLLNVKPNNNEKATDFWRRVVRKLLKESECLIVVVQDQLYIADSFQKDNAIMQETTFSNITIGDLVLKNAYLSSEVIYLKNRNAKIKSLLRAFGESYADMLCVAMGSYRISNAPKFSLKIPTQWKMTTSGKTVTQSQYAKGLEEELNSDKLKVILTGLEMDLKEIAKQGKSFDDIQKMENHIKETVAFMFDIPVDVFIGKTTEKSNAMNDMITFNVSPLIEIINDGINAFVYTEKEYLRGEMVEVDQSSLKHVDILDVAVQLDKLYGDGFSHNDLRGFLNIHELDEEWADKHNITKNYGAAEGGES